MRTLKSTFAVLAACLPLAALAEPLTFTSGEQRVSLLELYTSEGCSSCPPADRWLRALVDDDRLWQEVVPVALHVDYWDYIGWEDRFASPAYSRRQQDYVRQGAATQAYTPEFFVDGREWAGWFRNPELDLPGTAAGNLEASVDENEVSIRYQPTEDLDSAMVAVVAVLGMGLETEVKAGENRGRKLQHDFVVLGMQGSTLRRDGEVHTASIPLPKVSAETEELSIAIWVKAKDGTEILQSTGGYL